ncbi:MAG TPA: hypothetical protein VFQ60_01050 [Patescibacteria group bacterium]|nr:hypothetical protein [Patescibacteria group bacterium]
MHFSKEDFEEVAAKTSFLTAIWIFENVLPQEFLDTFSMERWLEIYRGADKRCKIVEVAANRLLKSNYINFAFWRQLTGVAGLNRPLSQEIEAYARERSHVQARTFDQLRILLRWESDELPEILRRLFESADARDQQCNLLWMILIELRRRRFPELFNQEHQRFMEELCERLFVRIIGKPLEFEAWRCFCLERLNEKPQEPNPLVVEALRKMAHLERNFPQTLFVASTYGCPSEVRNQMLAEASRMARTDKERKQLKTLQKKLSVKV